MNDINVNPWQEALDEQQNEERNGVLQQDLDDQRAMLADSENAANMDAQNEARNQLFLRRLMGTVIKRSGGGPISQRLANWANGALQRAGVEGVGIMAGGGVGEDGNFVIPTFSGVDQNGQPVATEGVKYGPETVFSMMNQLRGIFDDNDRQNMANRLRDKGVGEDTIASMSYNPFETMMGEREQARRSMSRPSTDPEHISNRMGGGAGGREIVSNGGEITFKRPYNGPRGVHSFSSDGQGGFSSSDWTPEGGETRRDWGTRDPNYQGKWKWISSGPEGKVWVNDKTGEEVRTKPDENLRDVLARSVKETKQNGGAGVEIAKINAASREKVAGMNNETKLNLANLSGDQKKELAAAANALKKYGIDVGLQIAQEKNESAEKIATQREAGRQSRAVMRDDQAWAKLAIEQEKVDKNFAVQMRKADTYGKRVDLIEQKIKNDYEIALKKAKTAEEKQQVEADYKDRMASVAEGNIDLGWFKAETAADLGERKLEDQKAQKEADRQLRRELADLRARTRRAESRSTSTPSRIKEINSELTALEKIIANGKPEDRKNAKARMSALSDELSGNGGDKATIKSGDNTPDEGTQEPPNGEYHTVKDGVSYHWGKSKSGKYGYFPDK